MKKDKMTVREIIPQLNGILDLLTQRAVAISVTEVHLFSAMYPK